MPRFGTLDKEQQRALFLAWLPAAIGVLVICIESTEYFSAAHTAEWLRSLWQAIFGASQMDWNKGNHILRKTGHFLGYGILSLLFYRAWRRSREILVIYRPRLLDVVYSLVCTVIVASGDEFHQSFLPSRTGKPQDVLLDAAGGLAFLILLQAWLAWSRRPPAAIAA